MISKISGLGGLKYPGKPKLTLPKIEFPPSGTYGGHCVSPRIYLVYHYDRHFVLGFWITAYMEGKLEKGAHLISVGRRDIIIDNEHCEIPKELFDLEKAKKNPQLWKEVLTYPQGDGHVVYFRRDEDDCIYPEECYIFPAIAIGLIGEMTNLTPRLRPADEQITGKKLGCTLNQFGQVNTYYDPPYVWDNPKAKPRQLQKGEIAIEIPYQELAIDNFLRHFTKKSTSYILHMSEEFSQDEALLYKLVNKIDPDIISLVY